MKYALDTNTLIYFFKGRGEVARNLLATAPADVMIPAVVVYEIETGISKSTDQTMRILSPECPPWRVPLALTVQRDSGHKSGLSACSALHAACTASRTRWLRPSRTMVATSW